MLTRLMVTIEITIVIQLRKNRAQEELESEKLKKDFVRWKILNVEIGNIFSSRFIRAGEETIKIIAGDFMEVCHEDYNIAKDVQFLGNEWLHKFLLA